MQEFVNFWELTRVNCSSIRVSHLILSRLNPIQGRSMRANTLCLAISLSTHLLLGCSGLNASAPSGSGELRTQATDEGTGSDQGKPIKFRPILSSQYANFPVNWSANRVYRLGLLRSAREYDQVFHAAAVAGNRQPYAPDSKIYENEMILVISRVTTARGNLDKAIEIDRIVAKGKTLEVSFTFREGPKNASYSVKVTGAARLPKQEVERVVFFEGKKPVGELQVDKGQWLVPEAEVEETPVP